MRFKRFSKQKEFTRAEKEAWKEVWKKMHIPYDNGGKVDGFHFRLPRTVHPIKAMTFGADLRNFFEKGNKKGFNRENAKTVLRQAGMDKMANQFDKVLDKYSNKRALIRWSRLKDRSMGMYDGSGETGFTPLYKRDSRLRDKTYRHIDRIISRAKNSNRISKEAMDNYENVKPPEMGTVTNRLLDFSNEKLNVPVKIKPKGDPHQSGLGVSIDNTGILKGKQINLGVLANDATFAHEIGHELVLRHPEGKRLNKNLYPLGNYKSPIKPSQSHKLKVIRRNEFWGRGAKNLAVMIDENAANYYGKNLLGRINRRVGRPIPDHYNTMWDNNQVNYGSGGSFDMANNYQNIIL